jgi:Fur family transcriptional regulator, ferric uptake regulator
MQTTAVRSVGSKEVKPQGAAFKEAVRTLRRVGMKVTRSRIAILDLLQERKTHMSADEITGALRDLGHAVDRVTVYRNLDRMLESGLLATVYIPGRAMRVGLRSHPGSPNHHFIVCQKTGQLAEIDSRFLDECWDRARQRIREMSGWDLSGYMMQFMGVSPEAQGTAGHTT